MKNLYNPIFPCREIESTKITSNRLDLSKNLEVVPFNNGYACFNGNQWFWINEIELQELKRKQSIILFETSPFEIDSWGAYDVVELEIELTRRCNQKCVHCWNESNSTDNNNLNSERVKELITEFRFNGGQRLLITGGEPLLYADLEDVLSKAKEQGVRKIEITTNGTLITDRQAEMLAKYLNYINVSLHGPNPRIHDSITQKKGSFVDTIAGIHRLKERGVEVIVYTTIMDLNLMTLPDMIDLIAKNKLGGIRFNTVYPIGRGEELTPMEPKAKPLLSAYIQEQAEQQGVRIISSELSRGEYTHDFGSYQFFGCNALRTLLYIGSSGDAFPCSRVTEPIGNIKQSSLSEVWRSQRARSMRNRLCDKLNTCNIHDKCGGKCKA